MKTNKKILLLSMSGLLYLSSAYSLEPHSSSNTPMGNEQGAGNMPMESQQNGMKHSAMDHSEMDKTGLPKKDMSESAMPASNSTETEMAGFSRGTVSRSIFTTLVDNREPVDKIKSVPEQTNDVFYFTELRDMEGQTAKHRWEYQGKVIAEVKFNVRGPRWRVWSKKSFTPGWSGDWKVSVVNGADEIISEETIAFNEPTENTISSNMNPDMNTDSMHQSNEQPTSVPVTPMQ